ncbi:MAG TPA: PQQ-dependent sugar dehydrogenase, partial [Ramlibacter sp.]|nr:PQQ-dependent sugar dehydrogenase [Ramlibacter sp.]
MGKLARAAVALALVAGLAACGGGGGGAPSVPPASLSAATETANPAGTGAAAGPGSVPTPAPATGSSQPEPNTPAVAVRLYELATGLQAPWSLAFLPDGRLLVTERMGRLQLMGADGARLGEITGIPPLASTYGQAGLLDVVLDPAFASTRRIFFTFAEADAADASLSGTAVARAELDLQARTLRNVQVIFRQLPKVASVQQFGARLAFDRTGHLFVTLGERYLASERDFAQ